jgi:hypothetical protein
MQVLKQTIKPSLAVYLLPRPVTLRVSQRLNRPADFMITPLNQYEPLLQMVGCFEGATPQPYAVSLSNPRTLSLRHSTSPAHASRPQRAAADAEHPRTRQRPMRQPVYFGISEGLMRGTPLRTPVTSGVILNLEP